LPKYHVFVAYGGEDSEAVAVDMAKCFTSRGLKAHIAVLGLKESIDVSLENAIQNFIPTSHAMLAVATDESNSRRKFIEEIETAKYHKDRDGRDDPIPVVAFLKDKARNVPPILMIGCPRIRFQKGQHRNKCKNVAEMVRYTIRERVKFSEQPPIVLVPKILPRRKLK
jgi:hypothetical protein